AASDLELDLSLRRQMNIVALHLVQTILADGVEKTGGRAVVESFRRRLRRVLQVHFDRVPLTGSNAQAVLTEGKSLLVARGNDLFEFVERERDAVAVHCLQQFINR